MSCLPISELKRETTMLNKNQKSTIKSYIDYLDPSIIKHLREIGVLNGNNTLKLANHEVIIDWFLNAINTDDYEVIGDEIHLEIGSSDTRSGNPELFDFPALEFGIEVQPTLELNLHSIEISNDESN
jgi:hypothetical protein